MRGAGPTRRAKIDPYGPGVYPGGHARGVRLGRCPRGPMGEAARGSEQPGGARTQQMGLHEPYPSQSLQPPQGVYKGLRQFARDRSKWDFASTHAVPIATAFVCSVRTRTPCIAWKIDSAAAVLVFTAAVAISRNFDLASVKIDITAVIVLDVLCKKERNRFDSCRYRYYRCCCDQAETRLGSCQIDITAVVVLRKLCLLARRAPVSSRFE